MDMTTDASWWWIATGVLIAVELGSGTFYLLMLALGTAGAAIAAHLGFSSTVQMLAAAILGGGAVIVWYLLRGRQAKPLPAQANSDVNLDIGEQVHVDHWETDGTTQVKYRGAMWAARYQGDDVPVPGTFVIRELKGSLLLLRRKG